jgi:hypothetical protein
MGIRITEWEWKRMTRRIFQHRRQTTRALKAHRTIVGGVAKAAKATVMQDRLSGTDRRDHLYPATMRLWRMTHGLEIEIMDEYDTWMKRQMVMVMVEENDTQHVDDDLRTWNIGT